MAAMNAALQGEALDPLARGNQDERRTVTCSLQALLGERARDKCQDELASCKIASSRRTRCAGHFGRKTITKDQSSGPCKVQDCGEGNRCTFFSMRWFVGAPWGISDFACDDFQSLQRFSFSSDMGASNLPVHVNCMCEDVDKHCKAPSFDCGNVSNGAAGDELSLSHADLPSDMCDVILQDLGSGDLRSGGSSVLCSCGASCNCSLESECDVQEICCPATSKHVVMRTALTSDDTLSASLAKFGIPIQDVRQEFLECSADSDGHAQSVQQFVQQDFSDLEWTRSELRMVTSGPSSGSDECQPLQCCQNQVFSEVGAELRSVSTATVPGYPNLRTPGFRPQPLCVDGEAGAEPIPGPPEPALGCPNPRTLGFRPLPPCVDAALRCLNQGSNDAGLEDMSGPTGDALVFHFDLEHDDGERLFCENTRHRPKDLWNFESSKVSRDACLQCIEHPIPVRGDSICDPGLLPGQAGLCELQSALGDLDCGCDFLGGPLITPVWSEHAAQQCLLTPPQLRTTSHPGHAW